MFPVDVQVHGAVTGRPTAPCPDSGAAGGAGDAGDGVVGPGLAAAVAGEDHDPSPSLAERAATSQNGISGLPHGVETHDAAVVVEEVARKQCHDDAVPDPALVIPVLDQGVVGAGFRFGPPRHDDAPCRSRISAIARSCRTSLRDSASISCCRSAVIAARLAR